MSLRHGHNAALRGLLSEAGMSAAELARNVNRLAAGEGLTLRYDRTTVAHWLSGSRPRDPVPQLVAEVLTRGIGRLVSVAETGLAGARSPASGDGPDENRADPLLRLVTLARADVDPVRRARLARLVFRQHGVPGTDIRDMLETPGPGSLRAGIGGPDVQRVRFVTSQFAVGWPRYGGGHARAALASYLGDDIGRLLVQPAPSAERRALLSAAAQLVHILGDMSADAGHQGLAQRYYLIALDVAAGAGDSRTRAITLRAMSVQAVRLSALRYAADLADAAVTSATGQSGDLQAFVLAQRAYVRAVAGERRSAYRDLDDAESHLGSSAVRDDPFLRYPRAGFAYRKGHALHVLGDTEPALDALRYAAGRRPLHEHRTRALSQARLTLVLLERGRVEEACDTGRLFGEEHRFLRSHRSSLMLREIRARLTPYRRVPEAADLLQRLAALTRTTPGP
ncbi:hypothetical protein GT045_21995 [Streptomyces sp. SID486]|uniref:hypothetical protein n=1 Tax=Streptomyces sp. SID486 TaxID=2690264 RepID=UPI00136C2C13|nr:hypothetical protein [Streptomyces sp. SID486]MYX97414.1 hypothetical protein [Streptomyces sp. SID486]